MTAYPPARLHAMFTDLCADVKRGADNTQIIADWCRAQGDEADDMVERAARVIAPSSWARCCD